MAGVTTSTSGNSVDQFVTNAAYSAQNMGTMVGRSVWCDGSHINNNITQIITTSSFECVWYIIMSQCGNWMQADVIHNGLDCIVKVNKVVNVQGYDAMADIDHD